jgi:hypothetical protein
MELAVRECKLYGFCVVWRDGKISLRNVLQPDFGSSVVEINQSSGVIADEFPSVNMSLDTVVNQYRLRCGYNITTRKYAYDVYITDATSAMGLEVTKTVEIEHPGLRMPAGVSPIDALSPFFMSRWLAYPNVVLSVTVGSDLMDKIFVGDVVGFVSDRVLDPIGLGKYETSVYATVLSVQWKYSERLYYGSVTLLLHSTAPYESTQYTHSDAVVCMARGTPFSPSAIIDRSKNTGGYTAGWDSTNKRLWLLSLSFGYYGTESDDGARFYSGRYIRIIETNPDNPDSPQTWGPIRVASDYETDGASVLTLDASTTLTGYSSSKEYAVEFADFGDSSDYGQGTWMASGTTRAFTGGYRPGRYG